MERRRPVAVSATLGAVVFDLDGTIADTEATGHRVAFNCAFEEFGLDWQWDEALYGRLLRVAGGKERLWYYIERYRAGDVAAGAVEALVAALHASKTRHFEALVAALPLRAGVVRLVHEARAAGIRLAIATTAARAAARAVIDAHPELSGAFDAIVCGEDVTQKKPAPEVYAIALSRLAHDAAACVAIEDSQAGVAAARGAGLATLVTVSQFTACDDFRGAACVLDGLGEPQQPARVIAGPAPPRGCVDLAFLDRLRAGAA
jgi:HAD superfamily hydrolase (TIGR01509 family)